MKVNEVKEKMPAEVLKKFTPVGHKSHGQIPGLRFSKGDFGEVDFETLTIERAEELVKNKFPYLKSVDGKIEEEVEKAEKQKIEVKPDGKQEDKDAQKKGKEGG
ncbi:MAG: hypothetical protein ACKVPJ_13510 [Chitinophagales bacterium]